MFKKGDVVRIKDSVSLDDLHAIGIFHYNAERLKTENLIFICYDAFSCLPITIKDEHDEEWYFPECMLESIKVSDFIRSFICSE